MNIDTDVIYQYISDRELITPDVFDDLLEECCKHANVSIGDLYLACTDSRLITCPAVYTALDMLIDPDLWATHTNQLPLPAVWNNFTSVIRSETCMFDGHTCRQRYDLAVQRGYDGPYKTQLQRSCGKHLGVKIGVGNVLADIANTYAVYILQ